MPGEKTFSFREVMDASEMTTYFVQAASVVKSADETVTSSTTLQDDDQLQITVSANTSYWVDMLILYTGLAAADLKVSYAGPSGATFAWVSDGGGSGNSAVVDAVSRTLQSMGSTPSYGCVEPVAGTGAQLCGLGKGVLTVGGTGGIFKLQWAQLASSATAVRIYAGSSLIVTRIT